MLTHASCFNPIGHAQWSVANPEWGRNWMVINNLIPNMEYEVRLIAKNEYGDTASSTLYRVKPRPRKGKQANVTCGQDFENTTMWNFVLKDRSFISSKQM